MTSTTQFARFAPGIDEPPATEGQTLNPIFDPSRGPGGVYARTLQGATPKYAINDGIEREPGQAKTLARMYIKTSNLNALKNSITDPEVKNQLIDILAKNPVNNNAGYVDFFLTQVAHSFQEKVQVVETLSDNYVAYYFGSAAPVFSYNGFLLNTVQDDQAVAFLRLYQAVLRGTQLARRGIVVSLRYDSYVVVGTMMNYSDSRVANGENTVQFSFNFLVKKMYYVNFTAGWRPLKLHDPFEPQSRNVEIEAHDTVLTLQEASTERSSSIRTPTFASRLVPPGIDPGTWAGAAPPDTQHSLGVGTLTLNDPGSAAAQPLSRNPQLSLQLSQ